MLALAALSSLYWLVCFVQVLRARRAVPAFEELPSKALARWPLVSAVVPARDEGAHVREALRAKLAEGYPRLQLVLVDDRSSDDTGAQARALGDERVVVTRVDTVPEGWLGKVHALHRGLEVAEGEWLLFSDADVHLAPGTLRTVVAWAEQEQLDMVAVLPSITAGDAGSVVALQAFFRMICVAGRLPEVADPRSSAACGIGAFNLVRRSAFDRTPGFEWLKMEIADDMGVGVMLKRSGAKCAVIAGRGRVSLEFYPSLGAMFRALEKNGAQAPWYVMLPGLAVLSVVELGYVAGALHGSLTGAVLAAAGFTLGVTADLLVAAWLRMPRWPALFPGLGAVPLNLAVTRSCLLALVRGGVRWRGTFYPTAAVRAGKRIG